MRLSFGNMALELNIFNLQRSSSGFDDRETCTLNWVEEFVFDDKFNGMFATEYQSFLIHDELYMMCLSLMTYALLLTI